MGVVITPSKTHNDAFFERAFFVLPRRVAELAIAALILMASVRSVAEDLVAHGLVLRGVTAKAVEGDTIRLSKGKIEKLVPASSFKSEGVELAFSDETFKRTLTDEVLSKFIKDSITEVDPKAVFWGITELLARGSPTTEGVLLNVCKSPVASEVIMLLMPRFGDRTSVLAASCIVSPAECSTLSKLSAQGVRTILEEQAAQCLRRRDRMLLQTILPGLKVVSREFAVDIERFLLELSAVTAESATDIEPTLTGMSQVLNGGSLLSKSGYVVFVDAIHTIASRKITESKAGEALRILSFISPQWKTDKTAELTTRALELFPNEDMPAFSVERAEFLRQLSEADGNVRKTYKSYLEYVLSQSLRRNEKGVFASYFKEYLNLNPDPSSKNDTYRFELAKLYLAEGQHAAARQEVARMRTGTTLIDKIKLLAWGFYFRSGWVFFSFAAAVLGGFLIFLREKKGRVIKAKKAQRELKEKMASGRTPSAEYKAVKQDNPIFRSMARMSEYQAPSDPRQIELIGLLAQLGLSPGATEKEIKQAFRQVAKSVHPDMVQVGDAKASDEFIELTRAYERSLEIIAELSGEVSEEPTGPV